MTELELKDQVLIALKDEQEHRRAEVLANLEASPETVPRRAARAEFLTRFCCTIQELLTEGRITLAGSLDGTDPDAVLRLVPLAPDPRFEIDPVFRDLLPPPSAGEVALLEQQILTEGCLDPLLVWTQAGHTFLVDGHTRLPICQRHQRPFDLKSLKLSAREEVLTWIWRHHLGRRNFTPEAESYARGRLFNAQRLGRGGDRRSKKSQSQTATVKRTAQRLAAQFKVARATLFRDAAYAAALDRIVAVCGPEVRTKVLCRAVTLRRGRAVLLAKKDEAEMQRLVADLLAGKKVPLFKVDRTLLRLVLPRGKPTEQATVLIERLGPKDAQLLREALAVCLHRSRGGRRSPDSSSD
jgi:hypothetical protein